MADVKMEKAQLNEGMDLFKQGELGRAEIKFREFIKTYPESDLADNACYNLAKVYLKRNDKRKALEWLDFLLEHYPKSDAAYFAKDEKVEVMRELGIGPSETPDELFFKAKKALGANKSEEAEKLFFSFLEKYPDEADLIDNVHYNLALIAKKGGKMERVKQHVEIIMTKYPDSDAALYAEDLLE